jgi:NAD+ kinase
MAKTSARQKIGIIYNEQQSSTRSFAQKLAAALRLPEGGLWSCSTFQEQLAHQELPSTRVLLTIGGDGTILRAARWAIPHAIPLLTINMGRLGFMTELEADEALQHVPALLAGQGWIEERSLLEARIIPSKGGPGGMLPPATGGPLYALNELVIGRASISKVIYIETYVDDALLATIKGDGLILATATGSTGYALAAGGPILSPQTKDLLLQPISPHFGFRHSLVLAGDSRVRLMVMSDHPAILSVDGQSEYAIQRECVIEAQRSASVARFLRRGSPSYFFRTLAQRLGLRTSGQNSPGSPDLEERG